MKTLGIHHVSVNTDSPQATIDFYTQILGLRLVKQTVIYNQPELLHLYFGDYYGSPGSIISFISGKQYVPNTNNSISTISFRVPENVLDFWEERLTYCGIANQRIMRFSEESLSFKDSSGTSLEITARREHTLHNKEVSHSTIPSQFAINGLAGITLCSAHPDATIKSLSVLGLTCIHSEGSISRFSSATTIGNIIDVTTVSSSDVVTSPSIHHICWRIAENDHLSDWQATIYSHGYLPTEIIDYQYFKSIFFSTPGEILFEIATDTPGFTIDEPLDSLGEQLKLPADYESHRQTLSKFLPPINLRKKRAY